jgi:glycosyltransferase involved in cell wall biosynthesis
MDTSKTALCVIVSGDKNLESLQSLLRSVAGYVDTAFVTTNGKDTSKIKEISSIETEKGRTTIAHSHKDWNGSFAEMRNFNFSQPGDDYGILFWADDDDIVVNPENIPKLAKKIEEGEADWIYLEYVYQKDDSGNVIAKHWKPRLMRKGSGHWVGDVHEDFMPDQAVIQKKDTELGPDRVIIEHTASQDTLFEHSKRNLDIQLKELERDRENTDPRTVMYTAMSYQGLGEFEKAVPYFLRHIQVTGSREDKYWSLVRAATCLHIVGRNAESLNLALDSLKLYPQWKTSYFLLAAVYHDLEDWDKAIEWTLTGLKKDDPDTLQVLSEIDYTILPLGRLAMAYLQTGHFEWASETAAKAYSLNRKYPGSLDLVRMCREALELEGFAKSFLEVAANVKKYDRTKAVQLFDLIPKELDDDRRIQSARSLLVPPRVWEEKSVAIYCGNSVEEWSYPSVFTGIGGSEKAVINMGRELARKGYKVTVYNRCGDMKGVYEGVEYLPYYFFNKKDSFDTLIVWRNPLAFADSFTAKRKFLWLHDIAHPEHFNQRIYDNLDKVFFLSKWHRGNLPDCPEEKAFITNNGISPDDFKDLPPKRPNSLIWSSSYDRGLLPFIKNILPLIKKEIPDVTLDVAYGWNNIEKEMHLIPSLRELYTELSPILDGTPGITHHGRISHRKLAKLMGECTVYPYASEFGETNNMTSQECQAAGVFVATTSQAGGTPERILFGQVVEGNGIYTNRELQEKFSKLVVSILRTPVTRRHYTDKALSQFSWESTANQWINELSL